MITLPLSLSSEADVLIAYRAAGGTIDSVQTAEAVANSGMVNCAGTPPTFFDKWTSHPNKQWHKPYKGMLDMREVAAMQAPSQQNGLTGFRDVERELHNYEFVGAHVAEWYLRHENLVAFLEVCPSGRLVFIETYDNITGNSRVVFLSVCDGMVRIGFIYNFCAGGGFSFGSKDHFAVRRRRSV